MVEIVFEILFDNLFYTTGVIFTRVISLGKYPSLRIKEKYKILFQTIGLIVWVGIVVIVANIL
jgi:hypothetical protein